MISITCTNCRTTLEMDEAFAGGVCRCQFCGTIQTVPSNLKAAAGAAKSFYTAPAATGHGGGGGGGISAPPNSGLDDLANAVSNSGSGLSGSGLRSRTPTPPTRTAGLNYQTPKAAGPNKVLIGAAALILVLLGVIAFLFLARSSTAPVAGTPAGATGTPGGTTGTPGGGSTVTPGGGSTVTPGGGTAVVNAGPNFCGLPLGGDAKIVYVIDRGNSTERLFDPVKFAVARSVETLGAGKQFAVVFWRRDGDADVPMADLSFPAAGLAAASADQASAFLQKSQDVSAGGATKIDEAMAEAVKRKPSTILIITAKGDLNLGGVAAAVEKARGSTGIKVHAVTVGSADDNAVLKEVAAKSGGKYLSVSEQVLGDQ